MTEVQDRITNTIAEQLIDGPCWIRSFQDVKSVLDFMLAKGYVTLVQPTNGRGRNMVGLTTKGVERFDLDVPSHCIFDPPKPSTPKRQIANTTEVERTKQRDDIAEFVANGGSINNAAKTLGITQTTAVRRWAEIREALGPQAV